jgi:WD40 repeat protein
MTRTIQEWLACAREPTDIYDLLGQPRFHPDRKQLLEAIRTAYAQLLLYQSHQDPKVVRRAIHLQRELGKAESILSDPAKLRVHQQQILDGLGAIFTERSGPQREKWNREELECWLVQEQKVHPARAADVRHALVVPAEETVQLGFQETLEIPPVTESAEVDIYPLAGEAAAGHETKMSQPRVFQPRSASSAPEKTPLVHGKGGMPHLPSVPAPGPDSLPRGARAPDAGVRSEKEDPAQEAGEEEQETRNPIMAALSLFYQVANLEMPWYVVLGSSIVAVLAVTTLGRLFRGTSQPETGQMEVARNGSSPVQLDKQEPGRTTLAPSFTRLRNPPVPGTAVSFTGRFKAYSPREMGVTVASNTLGSQEVLVRFLRASAEDFSDYWEGDAVAVQAVVSPDNRSDRLVLDGRKICRPDDPASQVTLEGRESRVGDATAQWEGDLVEVVGHDGEVHVLVAGEFPWPMRQIEAVTWNYSFGKEILDYRSSKEATGGNGDRVLLEAKRKHCDGSGVRFRLSDSVPLTELKALSHVREPRSRAVVGIRRPTQDYAPEKWLTGLAEMVRIHPPVGTEVSFQGQIAFREERPRVLVVQPLQPSNQPYVRLCVAFQSDDESYRDLSRGRVHIVAVVSKESRPRSLVLNAKTILPLMDRARQERWRAVQYAPDQHLGEEIQLAGVYRGRTVNDAARATIHLDQVCYESKSVDAICHPTVEAAAFLDRLPTGEDLLVGATVLGGRPSQPELLLRWMARVMTPDTKIVFSVPENAKNIVGRDLKAEAAKWEAVRQNPVQHFREELELSGRFEDQRREGNGKNINIHLLCDMHQLCRVNCRCLSNDAEKFLAQLQPDESVRLKVLVLGSKSYDPGLLLLWMGRLSQPHEKVRFHTRSLLQIHPQPSLEIPVGTGEIKQLTWSPDGKYLAAIASSRPSGHVSKSLSSYRSMAAVCDAVKGEVLHSLTESRCGETNDVAWSPDGNLVTVHDDGCVRMWDASSGKRTKYLLRLNYPPPAHGSKHEKKPVPLKSVAGHPTDTCLAVAAADGRLYIGDSRRGPINPTFPWPAVPRGVRPFEWRGVRPFEWNPRSRHLAVIYSQDRMAVWDLSNADRPSPVLLLLPQGRAHSVPSGVPRPIARFPQSPVSETRPGTSCRAVAWSADGQRLAIASDTIEVWDLSLTKQVRLLHSLTAGEATGQASTLGRRGRSASSGVLRNFDSVVWGPGDAWLAAHDYSTIVFWDASTGQWLDKLQFNNASRALWNPARTRLAVAASNGKVKICEIVIIPPVEE